MWSYDYLTPFIIDVAVCGGYDIYDRKARLFLTSLHTLLLFAQCPLGVKERTLAYDLKLYRTGSITLLCNPSRHVAH